MRVLHRTRVLRGIVCAVGGAVLLVASGCDGGCQGSSPTAGQKVEVKARKHDGDVKVDIKTPEHDVKVEKRTTPEGEVKIKREGD